MTLEIKRSVLLLLLVVLLIWLLLRRGGQRGPEAKAQPVTSWWGDYIADNIVPVDFPANASR